MFCRKNKLTDTSLVAKVSAAVIEELGFVKYVMDLMGEIGAASAEQSTGVSPVGEAAG
jgi:hypothetical protein